MTLPESLRFVQPHDDTEKKRGNEKRRFHSSTRSPSVVVMAPPRARDGGDAAVSTTTTPSWRPGEHTRRRAVFRELGNGPYRRRESFDAEKLARELAAMRATEEENDETTRRDALAREREGAAARESVRSEVRDDSRKRCE